MKKILLLLLSLASALSLGATTRVLFIGNSYTYVNDLPGTLQNLAASLGETIVKDQNTIGGYTLELHSTNPATLSLIAQGGWDYVVLQEQSERPYATLAEVAANTYPYAKILADRIKAGNPGATILFYMTWGKENGTDLAAFDVQQQRIQETYSYMAQANEGTVVPVGLAWQRLRHNNPEIGLYAADGSHPSMSGTYVAACAFFEKIFRRTPVGAAYTANLNASTADILQHSAIDESTVTVAVPPPAAVATGTAARIVLSVLASGSGPFSYQWQKDGVALAGATSADLALASVTPTDAGNYTVTIRNSGGGSVVSGPTALSVSAQAYAPPESTLVNISTRAQVGTGGNIIIAGFVVGGSGSKKVLIRAVGPGLAQYLPGTLVNPRLELTTLSGTVLAANDDWGSTDGAAIAAAATGAGAFALADDSRDAALIVTLPGGAYTALVRGVGDTTGLALVEVYDLDRPAASRLVNLSTRALVGTGNSAMIAGFVVVGGAPRNVLVRALGPTLNQWLTGTLPDPQLNLTTLSGTSLATNDNWDATNGPAIIAAGAATGAYPLAAATRDSALLASPSEGQYTPQITDRSGATGLALVEVYEAP